jgi:TetR/AcrR family transcriptional regulator, transcriptional repressor of bet genes
MSRTRNSSVRRKQIVEGLLEVMSEHGYEGATIALIAESANLATGVIHYHFQNKQSILVELIEYIGESVEKRRKAMSQRAQSCDDLSNFIAAYVSLGSGASPRMIRCWIAIGVEAIRSTEVKAAYQRVTRNAFSILEKIVFEALREHKKQTKQTNRITLGIMSAIQGSYHLAVLMPDMIEAGFATPTITLMANGAIKSCTQQV